METVEIVLLLEKISVFSAFKETSLKKTITVVGGFSVNSIYDTVFSKGLCLVLFA